MPVSITQQDGLSFDDVLLKPLLSCVFSRNDVSTRSRLLKDLFLNTPVISANMDTVTEATMANTLNGIGAIGAIHRFMPIEKQLQQLSTVAGPKILSVGVAITAMQSIKSAYQLFGDELIVLIDVAHGHSGKVLALIADIKYYNPSIPIIAGNVATFEGAYDLFMEGADCVKAGIGGGSVCSTRIVTGCGVPQLTAIMEASRAAEEVYKETGVKPTVIADGGIKTSGDIVKALVAGADTVMLGSLLSGTEESPGEVITVGEHKYKIYRGMASNAAQKTIGVTRKPEGVEALVPYKGSVIPVINDLMQGVRSGFSYLNSNSIQALRDQDIEFVRITSASKHESHPHIKDIAIAVEV